MLERSDKKNDFPEKRMSYILTSRNSEKFMEEALKNAKELLGPDDELIIVDGASTDGTLDIVKNIKTL